MAGRASVAALRPHGLSGWAVLAGSSGEVAACDDRFDALVGPVGSVVSDSLIGPFGGLLGELIAGSRAAATVCGQRAGGVPFATRLTRADMPEALSTVAGGTFVVAQRAGGPVTDGRGSQPGGPDGPAEHRDADRGIDSVLSHDVRGALRQAIGFVTVAQRGIAGDGAPSDQQRQPAEDHLDIALRSLGNADAMTDGVVRWLRTGDVPISVEPVAMVDVLARSVGLLAEDRPDGLDRLPTVLGVIAQTADSAGNDVDLRVVVDAGVMATVLAELLDNAVKFWAGDGMVTVDARVNGDWCAVTVTDEGPGLDAEACETAFEPGRMLQPRGEFPGVGMGLAIARVGAMRLGGWCWLEPAADGGTTATVQVPVAVAPASSPTAGM